jgi:transcription elongation factor B subunit 1
MYHVVLGNFRESEKNEIRLPEIAGDILEKVIDYLRYKEKYRYATGQLPEFLIEPDQALELLLAANYLDC